MISSSIRSPVSGRAFANNSLLAQRIHARRRVSQVICQNFLVVLAEQRRIQFKALWKLREAKRETGNVEVSQEAIMDRANRSPLAEVRMLDGLLQRQNRRMRHAILLHRRPSKRRHSASTAAILRPSRQVASDLSAGPRSS